MKNPLLVSMAALPLALCALDLSDKADIRFAETYAFSTNRAAQIAIAPAMNEGMWFNAATVENVETLRRRGVLVISPREGDLACGRVGLGRVPEPREIFVELK